MKMEALAWTIQSDFENYQCNYHQGGLPIKCDGGSECWAIPLTLKYKRFLFLTTLEYNVCRNETPEVQKLKNQIPFEGITYNKSKTQWYTSLW